MKSTEALQALAALAQESRLAVFRLLVRRGPAGLAAGEIASRLGLTPATLSFHLSRLENARLVSSKREGLSIRYTARFDRMERLVSYLGEQCCREDGRRAPASAGAGSRSGEESRR